MRTISVLECLPNDFWDSSLGSLCPETKIQNVTLKKDQKSIGKETEKGG